MTESPSQVTLRNFRPGDAVGIAAAWTKAAPGDGITETRFRNLILLDRNFDSAGLLVAEDATGIVGASYAVRRLIAHDAGDLEPGKGWIPFFFVAPEARSNGLGRRLVTTSLDWLAGKGVTEVVFSAYTPNYVVPGLDVERYPHAASLLRSLGFETLERPSAMDRSLIGYQVPADLRARIDALIADGWEFRSPTPDELVPLIELAGKEFNPDWARAIREGVLSDLPLQRIVIARDPEGQIIGWAQHGTYEAVIERFGPFGVLPTQRGLGLGRIILHLTMERMVALGAHSAWFLWADEGTPASNLYLKTGFEITRTWDILRAELPAKEK